MVLSWRFTIGNNSKKPKVEFKEMLEKKTSNTNRTKNPRFNSDEYAISDKDLERANKCLDAFENFLDILIINTDNFRIEDKRFPDEFYEHLFRLKNKPYIPHERGDYVGGWTNEIVYKRLAPMSFKRLKEKTPRGRKGRHCKKFHQSLTPYGLTVLDRHITITITLMKESKNYGEFHRKLEVHLPKYPQNGEEVLQHAINFNLDIRKLNG